MKDEAKPVSPVRFIRDEPSVTDYFNSHSRIARAISRAIIGNPEIRTIGLLGKWGSGKSTVVYHLSDEISKSEELSDIAVFTFDAWEHQSEPIRRSFLESLLDFLTSRDLVSKETWKPELDALTGRVDETEKIETPTLSSDAKSMLISLAFLPIGIGFLDLDVIKDGLGLTTTLAGRVTVFVAAICFLIPFFIIAPHFLPQKKRGQAAIGGAKDELFAIITNKTITKIRTKIIKSPDPTAIEFSEVLFKITADLFTRGRRLLCVIDNLDRLPAEDAVEMWATVRSLFSYKGNKNAERALEVDRPSHPIVIVPMDRGALLASFGTQSPVEGRRPDDDRATSFIDKTFDITFRVPPPVTSDWRSFLDDRLSFVFPERGPTTDDRYLIRRIFAGKFDPSSTSPTPRSINRFANALGALWLERADEKFEFPILAAFVANLEAIDKNVLEFAQSPSFAFLDDVNKNWRDQIAALYFGVPLDKGRQLLLTQPIATAIEQNDLERFVDLMRYPGAGEIFEEIVREPPEPSPEQSAFALLTSGAALLDGQDGDHWWIAQSWRNLIRNLVAINEIPTSSEFSVKLQPFHRHAPDGLRAPLIHRESTWLSAMISSASASTEIDELESAYRALVRDLCSDGNRPALKLSGKPEDLAFVLSQVGHRPHLVRNVAVNSSINALVPTLTTSLRSSTAFYTPGTLEFIRNAGSNAFAKGTEADYGGLLAECVAVVSEAFSESTEAALASLVFLNSIYPESGETIDNVIAAGHIQARLNETLAAEDTAAASQAIALIMIRDKPVAADKNLWRKTFPSQNDLIQILDVLERAKEFWIRRIWKAHQDSPDSRILLVELMEAVIDSGKLRKRDVTDIAEYADYYLSPLTLAYRNKLAGLVAQDEQLLSNVGRKSITEPIFHFFRYLFEVKVPSTSSHVEGGLELASVDDWTLASKGKKQSLIDTVALASPQFKLGVQSRLFEALRAGLPFEGTLSRLDKDRLFVLYNFLTPQAKRKLLEAILKCAAEQGEQSVSTLNLFGPEIIEKDAFDIADVKADSIVHALMPKKAGRTWVEVHSIAIQTGLKKLSRQERAALRDELRRMKDDRRGDRAEWSQRLLEKWSL